MQLPPKHDQGPSSGTMAESGSIEVTVKTLDSQSRSYTVRGEWTVKEFKEHIAASVEIPPDKQRLIYQGRVLQDEKTLAEYNVDGKVIHLVERAPPQTTHSGAGGPGVSGSAGTSDGASPSTHSVSANTTQGASHDRNANSYVMLGTFNLPVNIMDPQQIQMSVQQMMAGVGETGRSARVSTSTGSNGSVDVHINVDQSVQSEPRLRLLLAENLLRDTHSLIHRLEGQSSDAPTQQDPVAPPSSASSSNPSAQPMDTSPPPPPSSSTSSTQTEGPPHSGPNHPSPVELVEVLSELRRVEDRLQPFIQRTHSILGAAASADYNNNTHEREEDQRVLNLVGEALRLIGNALVALSDLRCNLSTATPRHLHVVRPLSHYTSPMLLSGAVPHIPIPINMGTTVTMTSNGRQTVESQSQSSVTPGQSEQTTQGQPSASQTSSQGQGQGAPRVIRITHQTMEPVVMMQMNLDDSGSEHQTAGQPNPAGPGQTGTTPPIQIPGLPPEFMQAIMHQISQQAVAMATAATAGPQGQQQTNHGSNAGADTATPAPGPHPPQARVVITRPSFSPSMPQPTVASRGATINLRATVPPSGGPQPGQAGPLPPSSLTQMISGLVGQLLMPVHTGEHTSTSSSSQTFTFSSSSSSAAPPSSSANSSSQTSTSTASTGHTSQPPDGPPEAGLAQLLGSLLGGATGAAVGAGAAGAMAAGLGPTPSITVTMPGVPGFIQGLTDFIQSNQPVFPQPGQQSAPSSGSAPAPSPSAATAPPDSASSGGVGGPAEMLGSELFTGIVQGVLSTMMGSLGASQNNTESIAQFIQRLSHTTNLFTPGTGDAVGFFGDLLSLVCQSFSMVDMVLLLHGQHQPLSRIQPQLTEFFTEHYLHGREPTDANIASAAEDLINGLEEYITESFSTVAVQDGVDITQTNLSFFRQQFTRIATHILRCSDHTFGPRLLLLCTQGLFECLALNLYCLQGEQRALTTVINNRIRRMSAEVNPSLVNWLTSMMSMRLHVILEHNPITEDQILHYVVRTQSVPTVRTDPESQPLLESDAQSMEQVEETHSPAPATTAEEAMASSCETGDKGTSSGDTGAVGGASAGETRGAAAAIPPGGREQSGGEAEPWAASVPPEWVPIIRQDLLSQRKMKAQPPLSDAYLHGMPAKRRKTTQSDGPHLSLSEAVNRAARSAGVRPVAAPEVLQRDLERPELQEAYTEQMKSDIKKRLREDPDFSPSSQRFPNTHRAFSFDS
ncbi:large proline-rich protein BAG6 isoform X1 [Scleropages formosus]|uniref:large proline-rich protein BAG6 isoform X1 n=2 Tax=Scleropages formosus TaxID=113540 RepID=UPI0010FA912B|nr:large proline-rich protein BAG6-like isoform X1 [Scleropages formosus]